MQLKLIYLTILPVIISRLVSSELTSIVKSENVNDCDEDAESSFSGLMQDNEKCSVKRLAIYELIITTTLIDSLYLVKSLNI